MNTINTSSFPRTPGRFVWQMIKPYWGWYILIFQAPLLTAFYIFANNYSLKILIDIFSAATYIDYYQIAFPVILFTSAQIALDVVWLISWYADRKAEPFVRKNILTFAYNYVQYHGWRFFQNTPSGAIVSKLKGILDGYYNIKNNMHRNAGKHFWVVLISVITLLIVNATVFWFMLLWCIGFIAVMLPMGFRLNRLSQSVTESQHQLIGLFSDNITNILSLFYFATRRDELKRLNATMSEKWLPQQIKLYRYDFKFRVIGSILYWFMLITVFLVMIYLRKSNQVSNGDFLFVMLTTLAISFDLWSFMGGLCDLLKQIGDFKSSFSILATPHEDIDHPDASAFKIQHGEIKLKDVSFGYDNTNMLFSNLNLTVKAGEKVGLVGHSGAGKSTLISLLLKNVKPTNGHITIDDEPLERIETDALRSQIALIPQDIMLFHRSIGENIAYAKVHASEAEVAQAAKMANLDTYIESLPDKYNTLVGERGVKLSGGQRQRIAIARAFLKQAPIVILDEATSSLDTFSEQEIQKSINEILAQNNTSVIAIAHRLSTIRHMDRIVVMEGGCIIEEGSFNELIERKHGYFRKLWDSQVNGMVV